MKRLFLSGMLVFTFFVIHAQIEVDESGRVGIRTDPNTSNSLLVGGSVKVDPSDLTFLIDGSGYPEACPSCVSWPRIYIDNGGNTGSIGSDSNKWWEAYISYIDCIDLTETSDIRAKKNIRPIENPLDRVLSLQGIMFDYKEELFMPKVDGQIINIDQPALRNRYGFSAQEVKQVDANLVRESGDEFLKLNYTDLIPVLVEAIKVQQQAIEKLEAEVELLKGKVTGEMY